MYKEAVRKKLRFTTPKGNVTVEDLWDLSLTDLNKTAKGYNRELKRVDEEDFLEEKSAEDKLVKQKFDIVIDVLKTKKEEADARKNASAKKAEKEKLLALIEKKQNAELEEMSEEDLKKKLAELD